MSDDWRHREFMLAALRTAMVRCKLMESELTEIGMSLKAKMIGPELAVQMLHDQGLMFLLGRMPEGVGDIAKTFLPVEEKHEA
jgi:hypothetical protein